MNEDCGAAAAAKEAQPQNGLVAVDPASEAQMEGTIDGQAGQQGRSAHATGSDVSGGNSARRNEDGTTVNTADSELELAWPEGGKEYVYETARADVQAGRRLNYAEMLQHLGWPNTKRARKLLSSNYFYNRLRIKRGATGPPTSTLQAAADTGGSPVLDAGASDGETEADDDNDEDEDDEELDALLLGSAAGGTAAGAGGGGGDVGDGGGNPEDEEELERRLVKALRESEATAGYLQAALDVMELAVADPGVAQYMLEQLKARLPPV
ncbi:hypothetical protein Agub_g6475 [Astrephomene gubernaculifera]|uniref:Uncharacterized protein n=1 Tax=Astrephomene gubernaculifera TaxID=47775 RepID=A0AAD3DQZ3_9CHLO|nr:hypothetical protein Agub_g6475 [Astrephomene gubernaculifera]